MSCKDPTKGAEKIGRWEKWHTVNITFEAALFTSRCWHRTVILRGYESEES